MKYNPLVIPLQEALGLKGDGLFGPASTAATLEAAQDGRLTVQDAPVTAPSAIAALFPRQADMVEFYGPAGGPDCTAGRVDLPMPFVLAWDLNTKITRFSCHKKLASPMTAIFRDAYAHYGAQRFADLRLNWFGGCYNFRAMRGGVSLSTHAWGVAVDIDPERNQLRWGKDRAALAGADYAAWWGIVESHGAVSLGRAKNFDWMHFQFARL